MYEKLLKTVELLRRVSSSRDNILAAPIYKLAKNLVPDDYIFNLVLAKLPLPEEEKHKIASRVVQYCNENNLDLIDILTARESVDLLELLIVSGKELSEIWDKIPAEVRLFESIK